MKFPRKASLRRLMIRNFREEPESLDHNVIERMSQLKKRAKIDGCSTPCKTEKTCSGRWKNVNLSQQNQYWNIFCNLRCSRERDSDHREDDGGCQELDRSDIPRAPIAYRPMVHSSFRDHVWYKIPASFSYISMVIDVVSWSLMADYRYPPQFCQTAISNNYNYIKMFLREFLIPEMHRTDTFSANTSYLFLLDIERV